jgi:hypothetical protein
MENKKNNQYTIYGITVSYLTESEKNVIEIMQKGEGIAGYDKTKEAIINWINTCLSERIISN